jgi:hypothetical protein
MFDWSALAQPAIVEVGTTGECAALASDRLVGMGSDSHCDGGYDRRRRCSGLCSLGQRGVSQPLWWRVWKLWALIWPLFVWSSWVQPATVVAYTTGEGAAQACVRLDGVGSVSHYGGGHDR